MENLYLCWVDDVSNFVSSYSGKIELLEQDHNVKFIIDEHYDTRNFDTIARSLDDGLTFLVDYNLKGADGTGIDGDELIKLIRQHNQNCIIVFYSSNATQQELRQLVGTLPNILCVLRESLQDTLTDIATGEIKSKLPS